MKHESLDVKQFTVKEDSAFRLRIESWQSVAPAELLAINFVQECLNSQGEVDFSSTYSYNITREELKTLSEGLLKL